MLCILFLEFVYRRLDWKLDEGKCVTVSSTEPVDSLKVNRNNEITVVMSVFWALYQALYNIHIAAAAKSLQSCPTPSNPIDGCPAGSPVPGILQARTRVGCHFLLQCMKVKSEREVAQSYPTLRDPMDCSLPGSSIHGIFQVRVLEWGAIAFSIFTGTAKTFVL